MSKFRLGCTHWRHVKANISLFCGHTYLFEWNFFSFDASQASIVTQKSLYIVRRETRIDPWRFVKIHTNWLQDSSGFGGRELFQEGGNFLGFSGQIRVWIIRKPLEEEILADSKHA